MPLPCELGKTLTASHSANPNPNGGDQQRQIGRDAEHTAEQALGRVGEKGHQDRRETDGDATEQKQGPPHPALQRDPGAYSPMGGIAAESHGKQSCRRKSCNRQAGAARPVEWINSSDLLQTPDRKSLSEELRCLSGDLRGRRTKGRQIALPPDSGLWRKTTYFRLVIAVRSAPNFAMKARAAPVGARTARIDPGHVARAAGVERAGEGVAIALAQVGVGITQVQREHLVGEADADVPVCLAAGRATDAGVRNVMVVALQNES